MIDFTGRGTFFPNWFHFLSLAAQACQEMEEDVTTDGSKVSPATALSAILFSILAAEAFINELAEAASRNAVLLSSPGTDTHDDQLLADLATVLHELEDGRGPITLKYHMTRKVLAGETFAEGEAPFQDFADLVKLRDELVHPRHRDETDKYGHVQPRSRVVRNLQQRGLTTTKGRGPGEPPGGISWVQEIESVGVARWAYSAAKEIMVAILETLPEDTRLATTALFRSRLDHMPR